MEYKMALKPQSHRIVRLLDRTIGCYLANVRPIGNVCYDLQTVAYCDRSFLLVVGHRTIGRTRGLFYPYTERDEIHSN